MELLQAFTYSVIDQCSLPSNQIATFLGYLHISFQPFFINLMSMYFIPDKLREKIQYPVYALCFASSIFMMIQLYPFEWAGQCLVGVNALCGEILCSMKGSWHIEWHVPANGITNFIIGTPAEWVLTSYPTYVIVGFVVPLLYGSWRATLYHFTFGPLLAGLLSEGYNEAPAVWCLLSIAILIVVVKTPVRRFMYVKNWFLWPASLRG